MRKILALSFLFLSFSLFAQNKSKTKVTDFYLEYSSSTKTILIKGNSMTVQEWIEQYDNPVSSMPGSRKEITKTSILSPANLNALKNLIKTTGFMSLPKNEYGAGNEERHYPYSISVSTGGKQKKVVYRSSPDPDSVQAPEAFSEVEKKIMTLIGL